MFSLEHYNAKFMFMRTTKDWREDLTHSRDLQFTEVQSYGFFIAWFDSWRVSKHLELNRDASVRFWQEVVKVKQREVWQLDSWAEAMRWSRKGLLSHPIHV